MPKKKYKKELTDTEEVKDPLAIYRNAGITFSTVELQGDFLLKTSMDKSPAERLMMMKALNEYAYKNIEGEKLIFKNARLVFSSYEYIP